MTSSSSHIRHGLYLPVDLLDQLRLLAQRENKSINKQIEEIIMDWFSIKKESKSISRKDLLKLPLARRHELLQEQAERLVEYYSNNKEFEGGQGDLLEYD
ncbi:MAG: hypothetical protein WA705_15945 [Candidatus Ozemobacteraceae bacterium]